MEGVETNFLLDHQTDQPLKTIPVMEGVETLGEAVAATVGIAALKTIPVMEGVETRGYLLEQPKISYPEDYPRYGGG